MFFSCTNFIILSKKTPYSLTLYLGVGGLIILAALVFFCLRKRRKDEFDGNFDPAIIGSGGGTLPRIDLGENGLLMSNNGVGVEEDDGMGGRLGAGPGGGGIITPYSFQPAPIGGTAIGAGAGVGAGGGVGGGAQRYQDQPQMQQMSNIGLAAVADGSTSSSVTAAGYPNEKRAMRQQQQYSISSSSSGGGGGGRNTKDMEAIGNRITVSNPDEGRGQFSAYNPQLQQQLLLQQQQRSVSSSSSGGGGRGGGGRNAKEMEAMGGRVIISNPDEGRGQQFSAFQQQQSYLQTGPGPQHQQQQYLPSSSSSSSMMAIPSQYPQQQQQPQSTVSRAGTAVVVHEDGGRVVLGKGDEAEGDREEVLNPEIPPTYDSLPVDVRRDS